MNNTNSARAGTLTEVQEDELRDLVMNFHSALQLPVEYAYEMAGEWREITLYINSLLSARDMEIERLRAENDALRHMAYEGRPCVTLTDAARLAMEDES